MYAMPSTQARMQPACILELHSDAKQLAMSSTAQDEAPG